MEEILKDIDENKMLIQLSDKIYEEEAVMEASYKFTDNCYIYVDKEGDIINVHFIKKNNDLDLNKVALEFSNEIIDQQIRKKTYEEYKEIREQLVKKAFSSINNNGL